MTPNKPAPRLGIGADGKPLPVPNKKRIYPRMYSVLMVNQDGSTYLTRLKFVYTMYTVEPL